MTSQNHQNYKPTSNKASVHSQDSHLPHRPLTSLPPSRPNTACNPLVSSPANNSSDCHTWRTQRSCRRALGEHSSREGSRYSRASPPTSWPAVRAWSSTTHSRSRSLSASWLPRRFCSDRAKCHRPRRCKRGQMRPRLLACLALVFFSWNKKLWNIWIKMKKIFYFCDSFLIRLDFDLKRENYSNKSLSFENK